MSPSNMDQWQGRGGAGEIRVGRDYQADIPSMIPEQDRNVQAENDGALLVWKPTERFTDDEIEEYLSMAKENFRYSEEQALGLVYWHRYDIEKAAKDLANFSTQIEEWTKEEKKVFIQGLIFYGKHFDKISQMLPEKSMSSVIKYYYTWKMKVVKSGRLAEGHNQSNSESDE